MFCALPQTPLIVWFGIRSQANDIEHINTLCFPEAERKHPEGVTNRLHIDSRGPQSFPLFYTTGSTPDELAERRPTFGVSGPHGDAAQSDKFEPESSFVKALRQAWFFWSLDRI